MIELVVTCEVVVGTTTTVWVVCVLVVGIAAVVVVGLVDVVVTGADTVVTPLLLVVEVVVVEVTTVG